MKYKDTLILDSVDFSHYLTAAQAERNDKKTLDIMQRFDYPSLFTLNNDYVDSPPSIGVFLMAMQALGATDSTMLYNTNSGFLEGNDYIQTTSYFSIMYR
jgi:MEMO1 family protein